MNRKRYIANRELSLAEYCPQVDGQFHYECWQDPAIQEGYNYKIRASMDEFCNRPIRLRLAAKYCFESYGFECIYAGCYETNTVSRKMLKSCGFVPHPDGDCHESHYLTGEPITQYDYVLYRKGR